MKLHPHAYTSWWDLHAWAGVVASVVLSVMFFTGAFALFREEISTWQDPRGHHSPDARCADVALQPLLERAIRRAAFQPTTVTAAIPDGSCAPLWIDLRGERGALRSSVLADASTGVLFEERAHIATFLFNLHFLYDENTVGTYGMYAAGLLAIALLVVLMTGLLIHLKDLARQLHQFRPAARVRFVWSDLHKVLGVFGLPFQAWFAFSGALLCLAFPLTQAWLGPIFGGDSERAERELIGYEAPPAASGDRRAALSLDEIVARARAARPDLRAEYVRVHHFGDASSTADVDGPLETTLFGTARIRVDAVDGSVIDIAAPQSAGAHQAVAGWIYGLHYARLGGAITKILFALLALLGCATILSGNWIWLERRDPQRARARNRVLARVTIGGGLGIAPAAAAMFVANRAVPIDASWHMDAETGAFVAAWVASFVASLGIRRELDAAVAILLGAAAMFAAVPFASATVTRHHLASALIGGDWRIAGVDLGLVVLALLLGGIALGVRRFAARRAPGVAAEPAGHPIEASDA